MAPKKNAATAPTASAVASSTTTSAPSAAPAPSRSARTGGQADKQWHEVPKDVYNYYLSNTPQRTKLIDVFLVFLAVVGALQFAYCILAGNYPFNAFISGFSATVGQFVLTISLRIQTTAENKADFPSVSPERAFADFVVCSLILQFFCINFIN
ncbi:Dolichyl-diphosphooligosaccharide--protein glycosyltransferase subunit DAD1 [Escovopsis weberi]|uniref:Dolichyl-diphosphooligosaccharide--protein glycosyltransferase subunit OST2 n=1 Tax=Escovopsis weberi TaxID=150374 RepID=A0A0M8N225_ESCWE|nr:Dolichyl-diphosphooligosaccharide--protein glycosyltransferase subunit DAD1 [Escovopsis weberi]